MHGPARGEHAQAHEWLKAAGMKGGGEELGGRWTSMWGLGSTGRRQIEF